MKIIFKLFSWFTHKKVIEIKPTGPVSFPTELEHTTKELIIKGNVNSKGEKIYHLPTGRFYSVTKPLEHFDTEEAAQIAGYRKSKM